jgi:serine/threonine-protein kinase
MIDGRGQVRITDFGLATLASEPTEMRSTVGTPAYMAPEQLMRGEVSVQTDI